MGVARAEDRAPWRHDPSADPGAKTEGGRHDAALSFPFGIGTNAANRSHLFRCPLYLISRPRFLHFTLNQHNWHWRSNVQVDPKSNGETASRKGCRGPVEPRPVVPRRGVVRCLSRMR